MSGRKDKRSIGKKLSTFFTNQRSRRNNSCAVNQIPDGHTDILVDKVPASQSNLHQNGHVGGKRNCIELDSGEEPHQFQHEIKSGDINSTLNERTEQRVNRPTSSLNRNYADQVDEFSSSTSHRIHLHSPPFSMAYPYNPHPPHLSNSIPTDNGAPLQHLSVPNFATQVSTTTYQHSVLPDQGGCTCAIASSSLPYMQCQCSVSTTPVAAAVQSYPSCAECNDEHSNTMKRLHCTECFPNSDFNNPSVTPSNVAFGSKDNDPLPPELPSRLSTSNRGDASTSAYSPQSSSATNNAGGFIEPSTASASGSAATLAAAVAAPQQQQSLATRRRRRVNHSQQFQPINIAEMQQLSQQYRNYSQSRPYPRLVAWGGLEHDDVLLPPEFLAAQPTNLHGHTTHVMAAATTDNSSPTDAIGSLTNSTTNQPSDIAHVNITESSLVPPPLGQRNSIPPSAVPATAPCLAVETQRPLALVRTVDVVYYLVPRLAYIFNQPYYWGKIDRFEAEEALVGKPEGTFLLRDSIQYNVLFSVSFRRYDRTLHARIEEYCHAFTFDKRDLFAPKTYSIPHLLQYYNDGDKCQFFEPLLQHPLPRRNVFSLKELCRATICQAVNYGSVDWLPLPTPLKEYLTYYHYKHQICRERFHIETEI